MDFSSQNELWIFKQFTIVCPYVFDFDSIEKRQPPEPAILCKLSDGKKIAFELVNCLDNSLIRSIYHSFKLERALYDKLEKLPKIEKQHIKTKFDGIMISITFYDNISLIKKQESIHLIFDQLWTKEIEDKVMAMKQSLTPMSPQESKLFDDILKEWNISEDELLKQPPFSKSVPKEFDLKLPNKLNKIVKRITFYGIGLSGGPSFPISEALWDDNPLENRINQKLKQQYKTNCSAELLIYYEIYPELEIESLAEYWILPCIDDVIEELKKSIFERIWLYSVAQNKVIYVFPDVTLNK
jgi:hypothetical protein